MPTRMLGSSGLNSLPSTSSRRNHLLFQGQPGFSHLAHRVAHPVGDCGLFDDWGLGGPWHVLVDQERKIIVCPTYRQWKDLNFRFWLSQPAGIVARDAGRAHQIGLDTIQAISVIAFVDGLTSLNMSPVLLAVNVRTQLMALRLPDS